MQFETKTFEALHYIVRYPENFCPEQQYPAILFLHGAGSRGADLSALQDNPVFPLTAQLEDFPFVLIAPQCHEDTWFDLFEQLQRFAKAIAAELFVDADRLYLMGASMGGYATWQLAMNLPDLFAAIVPICGGGMYWNAVRLKHLPVWAFHGALDKTVKVEESVKMVDAVNKHGGRAKLTIYPENTHDAWSDTYADPQVFSWLLEQKKLNEEIASAALAGSKLYG